MGHMTISKSESNHLPNPYDEPCIACMDMGLHDFWTGLLIAGNNSIIQSLYMYYYFLLCGVIYVVIIAFFTVKVNKGVVETTKSYFQARGQNEPM